MKPPRIEGLSETTVKGVRLIFPRQDLAADEPIPYQVSFGIVGGLRDQFLQKRWEEAYDAHDISLRVHHRIRLLRRSGLLWRRVGEPTKFVRKATFYWSRNDAIPHRIWVMIVKEGHDPYLPKDEKDAQQAFLDVSKPLLLPAGFLGRGRYEVVAEVETRWARHHLIEKGSASGRSRSLTLTIS